MRERQVSGRRVCAGLVLAILVAPVVTAVCIELEMLLNKNIPAGGLADEVGGALTFLVFSIMFGGPIAAIPGVILGACAIALARLIGTRSSLFYAAAGLLAGTCMAWVDTGRTKSAFNMLEALPFVFGGCLSALTYWAVAER